MNLAGARKLEQGSFAHRDIGSRADRVRRLERMRGVLLLLLLLAARLAGLLFELLRAAGLDMNVMTLVLLLIITVLVYVGPGRWTHRERNLLHNEAIVSADDSALRTPTLRSNRYGLVGGPDQLVRAGRMLIPVEHKPAARRVQQSHAQQVAAQCLLVYEVYGVRPSYGLLVLARGEQRRVEFTLALERRLLEAMAHMRALLRAESEPGPRWVAAKCRACGFRETCWELSRQFHLNDWWSCV